MAQGFNSDLWHQFSMTNNNYLPAMAQYNRPILTNGVPRVPMAEAYIGLTSNSVVPTLNNIPRNEGAAFMNSVDQGRRCEADILPPAGASSSWEPAGTSTVVSNVCVCTCSFTFTTPTQSYIYSPTLTSNPATRLQYSRIPPQTFAPTGCSAQWKHSVPQRMPWLHHNRLAANQGINVFTGTTASTSSLQPGFVQSEPLSQQYEPTPSCSGEFHGLKRRHDAEPQEECPMKVHLTEEKISSHMQELRIHNQSPPPHPQADNLPNRLSDGVGTWNSYQAVDAQGMESPWAASTSSGFLNPPLASERWQEYNQLENRLSMEDEMTECREDTREEKLHFLHGLTPAIDHPVLPKEIINNIMNPCRQLMIWSPPGMSRCVKSTGKEAPADGGTTTDSMDADENSEICRARAVNTSTSAADEDEMEEL